MKARMTALFVHGLGASAAWWDPLVPVVERLGLAARPLNLPPLEPAGPEAWCQTVLSQLNDAPVVLFGHSLGAAVCVEVAHRRAVEGVVLLACPPLLPDFTPEPPPDTGLSVTAMARLARFLRSVCARPDAPPGETVHFVGSTDRWAPAAPARRLPFPLVVIAGAGHGLSRSARLAAELTRHLLSASFGRRHLDPGLRLEYCARSRTSPVTELALGVRAPPAARLDVEVTTRCQLRCPACARTLYSTGAAEARMQPARFEALLDELPHAGELFFAGLGEPLLHPDIAAFVSLAAARQVRARLVTNGLLARPELLARLRDAGLASVTFSLDTTDEELFRKARGGAPLPTVLAHFRSVPPGLRKSIFAAVSRDTVGTLPGLIDLAADEGLPALALSDLNFPENRNRALAQSNAAKLLEQSLAHARRRSVLLIGPHFHDVPDAEQGHRRSVVRAAADLMQRQPAHRRCLAPWRIAVVGADGSFTPCDCAPRVPLGNVYAEPLRELWEGGRMRAWRRAVLDGTSPDCRACPRY
jgi:MoaA/NifB/PqqE/SkfB family radical SAM enzyme